MGYLDATLTQVFTCAQSGHITQRCHNSPDGKWRLVSANDVMHRKRAEDFGRFWKSQWVEMRPTPGEDGWFLLACGDLCGGCHTCWGGGPPDERAIIERLCFSPYVEEPLNSKVIKSFITEQRSRKCFRISRFLCSIFMDIRCTFHA